MLRITVKSGQVNRALQEIAVGVSPAVVVLRASEKTEEILKTEYFKKFYSQMVLKANELAAKRKSSYEPGRSTWQAMKEAAGFPSILGEFTGSTRRAISVGPVVAGKTSASGEVSLGGTWPSMSKSDATHTSKSGAWAKVGFYDKFLEESSSFEAPAPQGRGFGSGEEEWGEALEDPEDLADKLLESAGFGKFGEEASRKEASHLSVQAPSGDPGYIAVGPGKVTIKYPGSKPFVKKSEPMRTKHYGPYGEGIDFMYLTPSEVNQAVKSVIDMIGRSVR